MARNTEAKCKLCRREGMKLFLKGERCYTDRCAIERTVSTVCGAFVFACHIERATVGE